MKKAIQFMLLAALVVSVSGCANTNHPQAIRESSDIEALRSEIDENAVPKETLTDSFSESKTSSDDSVIDVKAETESSQAETPQPTAEQSPALGIQSPQTVVSNDTPKPESSKAVEPTTEPKPTPTQQPTQQQAEEKPTPEPALTESPQETAPPATPKKARTFGIITPRPITTPFRPMILSCLSAVSFSTAIRVQFRPLGVRRMRAATSWLTPLPHSF